MEKETQTFTNIPECLVQAALCKEERAQEILIFLGRAYFVPSKNWVKKKNPSHQSLPLSCFSDPKIFFMQFASTLLYFFCALKLSLPL